MPLMEITYEIAMAAGRDAAIRRMKSEGRKKWNRKDYLLFVKTFHDLMGPDVPEIMANRLIEQAYKNK